MLARPEFKITPTTQLILELMVERLHEANAIVTYAELEAATGRPIAKIRSSVYTARKHIRDDHGKWFGNVRGIGYRVATDEELPTCGADNRSRARNLHRSTLKILAV